MIPGVPEASGASWNSPVGNSQELWRIPGEMALGMLEETVSEMLEGIGSGALGRGPVMISGVPGARGASGFSPEGRPQELWRTP